MKKKTLFILCGEAFSGKSNLSKEIARRHGAKIVGRDGVYFALEETLALESTPDSDDTALWRGMWPLAVQGARNRMLLGESVVFDDNCFYLSQRDELRSLAETSEAKSILIYLDVPSRILQSRKEKNKTTKERHDVPSAWLAENVRVFERPTTAEDPLIYTPGEELDEWFSRLDSRLA